MRFGVAIIDERQDHLRVEAQAILRERGADVGGDVDVGESPDDADVVFLERLEAIAATVFGSLAGGLCSASERPRSTSRPLNGVTPRLIDRRKRASTPTVCRRVTPSRRPSPNIAASSISEGMTTAKRSPEMRAATEFGGRCLRSRSPICAMVVADVHAEVFIDDVQFIDVDVQQAPALPA